MAKFCTSCGSPVEETLKFCPKCGAQLAGAAGAAPPAPGPAPAQPPAAAPPAAAPAAAAPSGGGSTILKIVLGVLAFIFLVSLLGIGACVYIGYRAKQKFSAAVAEVKKAQTTFGTPEVQAEKGGEGSEAAAAASEDVPPYPGSTATKSGGGVSIAGINMGGQEYETPDPVDKVVAWYKDKFGSKINVQEQEGKAMFTLTGGHGLTTVTISREENAEVTKINIARIGK